MKAHRRGNIGYSKHSKLFQVNLKRRAKDEVVARGLIEPREFDLRSGK